MKLSKEWPEALHKPYSEDDDWNLLLPFCETLKNAFTSCGVEHIGLRLTKTGDRCFTFLKDAKENENALPTVRRWLEVVGRYVAIRDCLALSFALDYDRVDGNPEKRQTHIGALRSRAKTYGQKTTKDSISASEELTEECIKFLRDLDCYQTADAVVAMPPSRPDTAFDLPAYVAGRIAKALKIADCCKAVGTTKPRPPLKDTAIGAKLQVLEGTVSVDAASVKGKTVLLIDDLYQSGISVNYVGMLLLKGGANRIFGLACEKTCRNDDNLRSTSS